MQYVTKSNVLTALTGAAIFGFSYYIKSQNPNKSKKSTDAKDSKSIAAAAVESASADRFSKAAATWDLADRHQLLAMKGLELLRTRLPFKLDRSSTEVLEFGCGSGAVSVGIASDVKRVVALDAAAGMIDTVKSKIATQRLTNVSTVLKMIDSAADIPGGANQFDVIFTSMAFHHVPNSRACIKTFYDALKCGGGGGGGGALVIVDLEKTAQTESYHPIEAHGDVFFHGFRLDDIRAMLIEAGFTVQSIKSEFTINKANFDHPIFVAIAIKPPSASASASAAAKK